MLRLWKYEELRRAAGDLGGVLPSTSFNEVVDVLLSSVGDADLSLSPSEVALGARLVGGLGDRTTADEGTLRCDVSDGPLGEDSGKAVEAAVCRLMCCMLCARGLDSLFTG